MLRIHNEDTNTPRLDEALEALASEVVDSAFKVHSALGSGLIESVYEVCLAHELHKRGVPFERQVPKPVHYAGLNLDAGLRLDLLIAGQIVVEIKAVEALLPVHKAQVLTYLKLTQLRLGFLFNFNVPTFKEGLKRIIL